MTVWQYICSIFKSTSGPDTAENKYHKIPLIYSSGFLSLHPSGFGENYLTEARVYDWIKQCSVLDAKYMTWPGPYGHSRQGEVHEFIRFRIMCPDEEHPQSKPQQPFYRIAVIDIPRNTNHGMYCGRAPIYPSDEPRDYIVIYGQHMSFRFPYDYRCRLQRSMEFTPTCRPSILQLTALLAAVSDYKDNHKLVLSERWYSQVAWEALLTLFSPQESRHFYSKLLDFGRMFSGSRVTVLNTEKLQTQIEEVIDLYEKRWQDMQDRGDANLKAARQALEEAIKKREASELKLEELKKIADEHRKVGDGYRKVAAEFREVTAEFTKIADETMKGVDQDDERLGRAKTKLASLRIEKERLDEIHATF